MLRQRPDYIAEMTVTDLTSHRRSARARELVLWRVISAMHVELCGDDPKALRRLWAEYARDLPSEIRAREMLGEL